VPVAVDQTVFLHVQERFATRARVLFYARLALMAIGLGVLVVPAWRTSLKVALPEGAYWYLLMLAYQAVSYVWVGRRRARVVIFATLCLDLLVNLYLVAATGGVKSPLMATQLIFTMLFALLYPSPLAIIPPLLILPVVAKIDQILGTQTLPGDLLLLLWYTALNIIVVYVVVYLEGRERGAFQEVMHLQRQRREVELEGERTRIAREIHDSVGAALSGVMLQAEYLLGQVEGEAVTKELQELRESASEGMEELRRAVSIMRHEFHLVTAVTEYLASFGPRHRIETACEVVGVEYDLDPQRQIVLFRILQEGLANVARHAAAGSVSVRLCFEETRVVLTLIDDGKGFQLAQEVAGHYGLRNMNERVNRVGGSVEIDSAPGRGTRIQVDLPVA